MDGWPWRAAGMDFWNKRHGFLTPIVSEVRQSGSWGRAVDGHPWRAAGLEFWNKRHEFLTPIVSEVCQSGPWGRAVDGRPWRAAGMYFWNKRHGFLAPIVSKVSHSKPWTDVRDGPLGWTFETNGTASFCRLFQKSERAVGAGRGLTSVTGRWVGLLKQTARIPHADCFRSPSAERAVGSAPRGRAMDSRSWRAAGMNFSELLVSLFHFNQISVSQSFVSN